MPKIGATTKIFHGSRWYKEISASDIEVFEINARESNIPYRDMWLTRAKSEFKEKDLSLHSKTHGLTDEKYFREAELAILRAEIIICTKLGIKELIFHLSDEWESKKNIEELKKMFSLAKKNKVNLIYESNSTFTSSLVFRFFNIFPKINYNLDLGHLNKSYRALDFGCTLDEFLGKIKDRIVYMHAHNNDGGHDQHRAISDGTLDWKHVFDKLDFKKIKIIIEVLTEEDYLKSRKAIEQYFEKRR